MKSTHFATYEDVDSFDHEIDPSIKDMFISNENETFAVTELRRKLFQEHYSKPITMKLEILRDFFDTLSSPLKEDGLKLIAALNESLNLDIKELESQVVDDDYRETDMIKTKAYQTYIASKNLLDDFISAQGNLNAYTVATNKYADAIHAIRGDKKSNRDEAKSSLLKALFSFLSTAIPTALLTGLFAGFAGGPIFGAITGSLMGIVVGAFTFDSMMRKQNKFSGNRHGESFRHLFGLWDNHTNKAQDVIETLKATPTLYKK